MVLIKLGEAVEISPESIKSADTVMSDPVMVERFQKVAANLKMIAPKANDFLYFSAIMMHAAESVLLDESGTLKKDAGGNDVTAHWEKNGDSWKWICSDSSLKPYRNNNRDIFPEEELVRAHRKWIGRPLCLDHKSDSVDMIRGVIVDTYYDYPHKRIVALCALDKLTYPDLARKVSSRYATSVSMGTAVGKAICSDCGVVATTQSEYCDCMKDKSCYGEINTDLNPLELSIVVSGADHGAKIRHIVAAADSIAEYVDLKEQELVRLSNMSELAGSVEITAIKNDLSKALERVRGLEKAAERVKGYEQSDNSGEVLQDSKDDKVDKKFGESSGGDDDFKKLANAIGGIREDLQTLKEDVSNLLDKNNEDTTMSEKKAYFQGGGGLNDPSVLPYEKQDYKNVRDHVDKQMVGQMETGPVEGMHPGPASAGESEEQRKRRLQRLAEEQEERRIKRSAALKKAKEALGNTQKEAYFQGGGGPNEPAPGKPKYEKENYETTRDKEDKQMVGQKPFPGVGKVDGLYGDDLKRKQQLARAKLTAKFIKAANPEDGSEDKAQSRWQVFADKKLILAGTVDEITSGKSDELYDVVASRTFGEKLLETIRSENGLEKAANMLKSAQPAPVTAPMPAPAAPPPAAMEPGLEGEMPMGEGEAVDEGGVGDLKQDIPELLEQGDNWFADLRKMVEALTEEGDSELKPMDELAEEAKLEGEPALASMSDMQKKLAKSLLIGSKQALEELGGLLEELKMAKYIYDNKEEAKKAGANKDKIDLLTKSALNDTRKVLSECEKLARSFVKFAEGTKNLTKEAQDVVTPGDARQKALEEEVDPFLSPLKPPEPPEDYKPYAERVEEILGPAADDASAKDPGRWGEVIGEALEGMPEAPPAQLGEREEEAQHGGVETPDWSSEEPMPELPPKYKEEYKPTFVPEDLADDGCAVADEQDLKAMQSPDGTTELEGTPEEVGRALSSEHDLTTKEGRTAFREELDKMAQTGLSFCPCLKDAHPGGGVTTDLDVKPTGDLAKVETLEEAHTKMMDVATAPPSVRKAAEDIQKYVTAGEIDPGEDFDKLVSLGLDPEAVKYWKQYYGQAGSEGKQFASELVKEYKSQKLAEEKQEHEVKVARAYELVYDMVDRSMLSRDRTAVKEQVKAVMAFNDEGFDSFKRYVDRQPLTKQASELPMVGLGSDNVVFPAPQSDEPDLTGGLDQLWNGRRV
jgi:hypothetical protein